MNFYKNQELQITAKFVGVADDGKVQVKIKGIDNVIFNVDSKYVNSGAANGVSPVQSTTSEATPSRKHRKSMKKEKRKSKKITQLEADADAAWASDDDATGNMDDIKEEDNDPIPVKKKPVEADEENGDEEEDGYGNQEVSMLDASAISIGEEKFHPKHKYKGMTVEQGGSVLTTQESRDVMCAFGTVECGEANKVYHWKLQILEGNNMNLGVIFSDQAKKNKKQMWWLVDEGYSYWSDDGMVYHSDKYKKYGEKYGKGDVIDVILNLKKYNIAFGKNGEKLGKAFKVNKEQTYRLAVGAMGAPHTLQLISFTIKDK